MNRFVFIAVNYNGSNFTKEYIESINKLTLSDADSIEIIIVDNKSQSKDFESLKAYCSTVENVRIIRLAENLGYFKGLNQGIAEVDKVNLSMLIVGNNDLTFNKDFIRNLEKIDYGDDVLVIAPNITTKEGRQQNPHVIDKVSEIKKLKDKIYFSNYYLAQALRFINQSLKKLINKPAIAQKNYGPMKIKRGIGACYLLTSNFFVYFEKLDDRVFLWGEEALLSNQVENVKGCIFYEPTIKITHHESASVKTIQSRKKYDIVKESYKIYKKYL